MRVLCHAQHFKGIGHFVRMHAIARGMSEAHEVYLGLEAFDSAGAADDLVAAILCH